MSSEHATKFEKSFLGTGFLKEEASASQPTAKSFPGAETETESRTMDTIETAAVPELLGSGNQRPHVLGRTLAPFGKRCFSARRCRALTFAPPPLRRRTVRKPCRRTKRARLSRASTTCLPDDAEDRRVPRPGCLQWQVSLARAHASQPTRRCFQLRDAFLWAARKVSSPAPSMA